MKQLKNWAASLLLFFYIKALRILRAVDKKWSDPDSVLLLPPTSPGSLGDQAIIKASVGELLAQGRQKVTIISYADSDDWSYITTLPQVTIFSMQDSFAYSAWRNRFSAALLASRQDHFYYFGTDQMDGFYHEEFLLKQLMVLRLAAQTGAPCTIVGFSYNKSPTPAAVSTVKDLPANVQLCVRDPESMRSAQQHLRRKLDLTADVAFLLTPRPTAKLDAWLDSQRSAGRILVGVNLNYLFLDQVANMPVPELVRTYLEALAEIRASYGNVSFMLLPHDTRGDTSDFALSQALLNQLAEEDRPYFACLPAEIQADEIKSICGKLDIVLSGRMHVAIACLGQGTPVACMTYQDKFDGLYEHFGLSHMTVSPDRVLQKGELARFFLPLIQNRAELRAKIQQELPRVMGLARANLQK